MGVDKWIDLQLHPESIDDRALEPRLAPFLTLNMSSSELAKNLPSENMVQRTASEETGPQREAQGTGMPGGLAGRDPEVRPEVQIAQEKEHNQREGESGDASAAESSPRDEEMSRMLAVPPGQRLQALFGMPEDEQSRFIASLRGKRRKEFVQGMTQRDRGMVMARTQPQLTAASDLRQSKILRAVYSERQLLEVMTDFWMNHFNIFIGKGSDNYQLTSYERDVIRPRALGNFEDLLVATARSPAMLVYLDNWLSVGPNSVSAVGRRSPSGEKLVRGSVPTPADGRPKGRHLGLNENYGRELLELHTLGVDGGYAQKDVTEVAKVFTGWTIEPAHEGGGFKFDERRHEPGSKTVVGHEIKENGEKEGYEALHILATHPSTARFISRKLAVRFVADDPPGPLVDRMAETFLKTGGNIREVLQVLIESPEFWEPESYRAKVKTPFEFVISALRATGAEVTNANVVANQLQLLGMPLYGEQAPKGYSMRAEAWVSTSALLGRMNFAVRLASGRIGGIELASPSALTGGQDARTVLAQLERRILADDVGKQTHETVSAQLHDPPDIGLLEGLLLASPEFQQR